jgi:uncharacterized protein (DUF58 family)
MALTARAVLVALGGVVVVALVGPIGFAVVEGALAGGVLVDVLLAGGVRQLRFQRAGPTSVRQGEPAVVRLLVANPGRRVVRGRLRDAWPPSAGATPRDARLQLPPGEQRWIETTVQPTRRGDRRAVRVTVRSVGPLGLAGRQGSHVVPWTVRVLPAFASRRYLPEKLSRLRQLDGLVAANVRGQGSEFDSLREYVVGDDVRSIDWRATARGGGVAVRTWRPERDRRIVVVLDTGRTSAGRVGDAPRFDWSLDAALLLAALASRAGDRVDVLAYDRRVRAAVASTRNDPLPAMVQALATVEPDLVETDVRGAVAEVLRRARQRCLVVWFTALDPAPMEEGLLPALPALVHRHLLVVASVGDPRVQALAAGRGDAEAVYGAAAAEQSARDRARMTATLRQRGVDVVDAQPEVFAPAVADAYLSLKAAGRL